MRTLASCMVAVVLIFTMYLTAMAGGYIIGDEDVLQISVWGNQELSVTVPVRPDGKISVPLLGDVQATGVTPQELKVKLEQGFSKFVKTPVVSVMVTAVNSFKVYVFGEGVSRTPTVGATATGASSSGVITLRKNTTLIQLLAQLGSLKNADLKNAYLLRGGQKLSVDFSQLVARGDVSQDIELAANDVIYIPDNFDQRIRVTGAVKTPVIVPFSEGMTALDAVLSAGGFTEFASQNSVIVVRKDGTSVKNIEVKLKDVMNGNINRNIFLQPGDIVVVNSNIF
ncbi:MAG TPA: polysaccharide biosynthesis/export family protein [Nitrospirota bacterium]|nr:polysaccharide biosynthesis/export family protein [Nitrospirota bacterium]